MYLLDHQSHGLSPSPGNAWTRLPRTKYYISFTCASVSDHSIRIRNCLTLDMIFVEVPV